MQCNGIDAAHPSEPISEAQNVEAFLQAINKHQQSIVNRDIDALKTTLHPSKEMQFILSEAEMIESTRQYILFHKAWFMNPSWQIEPEIINYEVGDKLGFATSTVTYNNPQEVEQGIMYTKMITTYILENLNGKWYVIRTHATIADVLNDSESFLE